MISSRSRKTSSKSSGVAGGEAGSCALIVAWLSVRHHRPVRNRGPIVRNPIDQPMTDHAKLVWRHDALGNLPAGINSSFLASSSITSLPRKGDCRGEPRVRSVVRDPDRGTSEVDSVFIGQEEIQTRC